MLYPTEKLLKLKNNSSIEYYDIWKFLNDIPKETIMKEGRFYGGGLNKIEPAELMKIDVSGFHQLFEERPKENVSN